MSTLLIQNLSIFNRKERFHLLSDAFDLGRGHSKLSEEFTKKVAKVSGISPAIPNDAFWAMDYHLDWIYASLWLSRIGIDLDKTPASDLNSRPQPYLRGGNEKISGTQEDIDFLIAYRVPTDNKTCLIMIEAKFDSAWSNSQLESKARRLKAILGEANNEWEDLVAPHFVIASPTRPKDLVLSVLPDWARKIRSEDQWIKLKSASGERSEMVRVVRCDSEGNDEKGGGFWKVQKGG